ncbi:MAG: hypothetical protein PQJ50_12145 [Spirochaetales bacterium]|nr:hypothetical protein [Spirochaetales bacterium]
MKEWDSRVVNSDKDWYELVTEVLKGMPELEGRREFILNHRLCRLIGMLPGIAGTTQPLRDGFTNLSLFLLSKHTPVKDVYDHKPQDDQDILRPLIPYCHFTGGDERILSRGMHLIAMVLLVDYKKNKESDLEHNRYNPLNSGQWDYVAIMDTLSMCVEDIDCPVMDDILSVEYVPFTTWALGA